MCRQQVLWKDWKSWETLSSGQLLLVTYNCLFLSFLGRSRVLEPFLAGHSHFTCTLIYSFPGQEIVLRNSFGIKQLCVLGEITLSL